MLSRQTCSGLFHYPKCKSATQEQRLFQLPVTLAKPPLVNTMWYTPQWVNIRRSPGEALTRMPRPLRVPKRQVAATSHFAVDLPHLQILHFPYPRSAIIYLKTVSCPTDSMIVPRAYNQLFHEQDTAMQGASVSGRLLTRPLGRRNRLPQGPIRYHSTASIYGP